MDDFDEECTIALVGKYVKIDDAYASLNKALQHAAIHSKRRLVLKVCSKMPAKGNFPCRESNPGRVGENHES